MHDVRNVRTFKTKNGDEYESWYYGKTVKNIDIIIKSSVFCKIGEDKGEDVEIFVAAPDQKALTGLLAEINRNLTEKSKSLGIVPILNINIKDNVFVRSTNNLLNFCDFDDICTGDVIIQDNVITRSEINISKNKDLQIEDSVINRSSID